MKKNLTVTFINIILVLIQGSFLRELMGPEIAPNLVIAFAYSLLFMGFEDISLTSIFMGGLFLDLFGFNIVGLSPLVLTGSLILFKYVKKYLFRGWLSNIVIVFLAELIYSFVIFGFSQGLFSTWRGALSTLIFSLIFYMLNQRFKNFFGRAGYSFNK
ncbi:hypothetical protein HN803_08290 [candidate division WWE3 bacterium]|jgi:hypothetical protein|nr:hypothetical protein [candidate division WWE3 bacterium]MBT7350750.1 hypothetical protein [candidate division WWE3 bacterium]